MRDNGLEASSYVAIADLDPRVADNMLDILREVGVAAYAEPCQPQQGLLLEVTLPPAPLDRLHVDREEALRARQLLRELLAASAEGGSGKAGGEASPERPAADAGSRAGADEDSDARVDTADSSGTDRTAADDDLIWAQIVEAYERESKDPVAPWPAVEDTDDDTDTDTDTDAESGTVRAKNRDGSDPGLGPTGGETETADSETATTVEQERYVPPPPPPLPKLDPITKLCWGVLVAGPVMMLLAAFASGYVPSWFMPLGVVAFVGGFVALVFRMRGGPPDESDDGAVV